MNRPSFLDAEPPPGYIAGIGRGATGFSTQADVGGASTGRPAHKAPIAGEEGQFDDADEDEIGYTGDGQEEDDDEEADEVFGEIDKKLKDRREGRKRKHGASDAGSGSGSGSGSNSAQVHQTTAKQSVEQISESFSDVKQGLSSVTEEQWEKLPESGDFTRKNKRRRQEMQAQQRFYRNSDSVTLELRDSNETETTSDPTAPDVDLAGLSKLKDQVLAGQLSLGEDGAGKDIDKAAYLGELSSKGDEMLSTEKFVSNIGDYSKTRALFAKMRKADPYKGENWIASARLESEAHKPKRAKQLVAEGCQKCPKDEQLWLVALDIYSDDVQTSKVLVADAVRYNPKSLSLWLKAVDLESDNLSRKRVLMKALEFLPTSPTLWLEIVKYEDNDDMKVQMLEKATTLEPSSLALWLRLAELQPLKEAQKTLLEKAQQAVKPEDAHVVWISAAKITERATDNEVKVTRIVEQCFEKIGTSLGRYEWLHEAVVAETEGYPLTTRAIVFNCMPLGLDETDLADKIEIWRSDADSAAKNSPEVARSAYLFATSNSPKEAETWQRFIDFERSHRTGSPDGSDKLYVVYEMATKECPHHPRFYLMYAKDKWQIDSDVEKARSILKEGMDMNPQCEDMWFASAKLEWSSSNKERALELYIECQQTVVEPSARVWYKHVTLERCLGHANEALDLALEGSDEHPEEPKLYLEMGQIYLSMGKLDEAVNAFRMGTRSCPSSIPLWINLSRAYSKQGKKILARSTLEEAGAKNGGLDLLQLVYIERLRLDPGSADLIIAKGLREMPGSPMLWAEAIRASPPAQRKNMYGQALTKTGEDPYVILAIARDLWQRTKLAKAKQFFDAAVEKDGDFGDVYIYYHAFLQKHGDVSEVKALEELFLVNDPHHGYEWPAVTKDLSSYEKEPLELLREASRDINR